MKMYNDLIKYIIYGKYKRDFKDFIIQIEINEFKINIFASPLVCTFSPCKKENIPLE